MIILSGPLGPKFMADAFVVSVNVGEGGPGDATRLGEMAKERRERARGIVILTEWRRRKGQPRDCCQPQQPRNDVRSIPRYALCLIQTVRIWASSARDEICATIAEDGR